MKKTDTRDRRIARREIERAMLKELRTESLPHWEPAICISEATAERLTQLERTRRLLGGRS